MARLRRLLLWFVSAVFLILFSTGFSIFLLLLVYPVTSFPSAFMELASHFTPWGYVLALLLQLPYLLLKRNIIVLTLVLVTITGSALTLPTSIFRLPASKEKPPGALRIATANLRKQTSQHRLMQSLVKRYDIDIVAIQEYNRWTFDTDPVASLRAFESALGMHSGLDPSFVRRASLGQLERIVFSRFPDITQGTKPYTPFSSFTPYYMEAAISLPSEKELTVAAVHFRPRRQPIDEMTEKYDGLRTPFILCGDLNATEFDRRLKPFRDAFTDAHSAAGSGFGFTFPRRFPLIRIDHLFSNEYLKPLNCFTVLLERSDHLMVIADYKIR
jgi:endonuclease/exonuclease/phosphatase family metal-dependent hydrolase